MRCEVEWGDFDFSCVAVALWLVWGAGFNLPDVLVHAGQVRQLLHYRTVALTLVLGSDSRGVYFLRALDRGGFSTVGLVQLQHKVRSTLVFSREHFMGTGFYSPGLVHGVEMG